MSRNDREASVERTTFLKNLESAPKEKFIAPKEKIPVRKNDFTAAKQNITGASDFQRLVFDGYGMAVDCPSNWTIESEARKKALVAVFELLEELDAPEGKVRLLNAGLPPTANEGYRRLRLSIQSGSTMTQGEVALAGPALLAEAKQEFLDTHSSNIVEIERDSVDVSTTRFRGDYWALTVRYVRSGTNGSGRTQVIQHNLPFRDRAVLLTVSYALRYSEIHHPISLRITDSLFLSSKELWPTFVDDALPRKEEIIDSLRQLKEGDFGSYESYRFEGLIFDLPKSLHGAVFDTKEVPGVGSMISGEYVHTTRSVLVKCFRFTSELGLTPEMGARATLNDMRDQVHLDRADSEVLYVEGLQAHTLRLHYNAAGRDVRQIVTYVGDGSRVWEIQLFAVADDNLSQFEKTVSRLQSSLSLIK